MNKSGTVYRLKCEQDKWYVGHTENLNNRLNKHMTGGASMWTDTYRPINPSPFSTEPGTKRDENRITLELMREYGWKNVAGGLWSQVIMPNPPKEYQRLMNGENIDNILDDCEFYNDRCFRCKRTSHYFKKCVATTDIYGNYLD